MKNTREHCYKNGFSYSRKSTICFFILFPVLFFNFLPQSSDQIRNQPLKVGYTISVPSTYINEQGKETGILIDLFNYIVKEVDWEIEYIPGNFADMLEQVMDGRVDLLLNMARTEAREEFLYFTEENLYNSWAEIIVRKESEIKSITDLADQRIGALKNSNLTLGEGGLLDIIEKFELKSEVTIYDSNDEIIIGLVNNEIDAGVTGRFPAISYINDFNLKKSGIIFLPTPVKIGVSKMNPNALSIANRIDNEILRLKSDPDSEYYKAFERYLTVMPSPVAMIPEWLQWTLYSGMFLLILVLTNSIILKWKVNQRTSDLSSANKKLQESEFQYRDLVEKANVAITIEDTDGKLIFANNINAKIYGYTADEMLNKSLHSLVHSDHLDYVLDFHKRRIAGEKIPRYEFKAIKKDGSELWLEVDGEVFEKNGKVIGVKNFFWEISERKRAEEKLKETYNLLETGVDNMPFAYTLWSKDLKILKWNRAAEKIFGYSANEIIGKDGIAAIVPKKNHEVVGKVFRNLKVGVIASYSEKDNNIRKDGTLISCEWHNKPLTDLNGNVFAILAMAEDVTENLKAEERLRESEERFDLATKAANVGLWDIMINTGEVYFSPLWMKMLGYGHRELPHTFETWLMLQHPEDKEKSLAGYNDYLEGVVKDSEIFYEQEFRMKTKDGTYLWILGRGRVASWENGNPVRILGTHVDITEQKLAAEENKKLEEQLFQAQKMESIGRLAGGIAHDFNNILTGIMGYSEVLLSKFKDSSTKESNAAGMIMESAERAAHLTHQLLGFAREGKFNPVPLKINEVIVDSMKVAEKIFEKNVQLNLNLGNKVKTIKADKTQVEQILMNMIINANDAMPLGGNMSIRTTNELLDEKFVENIENFEAGQYVKLTISDDGTGIPKEIQSKIFEPFFTTKDLGRGTGLGLANVYGIMKNHNGHVNVYSEEGLGTTFSIYFPASDEKVNEQVEDLTIKKGNENILVVDDEETVRFLEKELIESLGYSVITAKDGTDAIHIFNEKKDVIDLVILDMLMPKMAGSETYRELKKIDKNVKAILVSGFSKNDKVKEILDAGINGFLQKPFKLHELSKIIYDVIRN